MNVPNSRRRKRQQRKPALQCRHEEKRQFSRSSA
jgi:hypothetical protein